MATFPLSLSIVTFCFLDNPKHSYGLSMVSCTLDMCGSSFLCSAGHLFLVPVKLVKTYIISVTVNRKCHLIKMNMLNYQYSVYFKYCKKVPGVVGGTSFTTI